MKGRGSGGLFFSKADFKIFLLSYFKNVFKGIFHWTLKMEFSFKYIFKRYILEIMNICVFMFGYLHVWAQVSIESVREHQIPQHWVIGSCELSAVGAETWTPVLQEQNVLCSAEPSLPTPMYISELTDIWFSDDSLSCYLLSKLPCISTWKWSR